MSQRIALTDGSGQWFDQEKAAVFHEATYWDGSNRISKATSSQWNHEAVWFTGSGNWILNCWSQSRGTAEIYVRIDEDQAIRWLCRMEHFEGEAFDKLPEDVRQRVAAWLCWSGTTPIRPRKSIACVCTPIARSPCSMRPWRRGISSWGNRQSKGVPHDLPR